MGTTINDGDRDDGVMYTCDAGLVTAIDTETHLAGCGESKHEALRSLSEVLELHEGGGEPVTDKDAFLREIGLDPEEINEARERTRGQLPEFFD